MQCTRNRHYDPKTGRFTQEDANGIAGGLNLYGFADGDPISHSDPFGLCPYAGKNRSTKVDDCPDDDRKAVFQAIAANPSHEAQTTLQFFALLELDFKLRDAEFSCGRKTTDGCTRDGRLIEVNGSQPGGHFAVATTVIHEVFHAIVYASKLRLPYDEGWAWNRALNFYESLSPAHQSSPKYNRHLNLRQKLGTEAFVRRYK